MPCSILQSVVPGYNIKFICGAIKNISLSLPSNSGSKSRLALCLRNISARNIPPTPTSCFSITSARTACRIYSDMRIVAAWITRSRREYRSQTTAWLIMSFQFLPYTKFIEDGQNGCFAWPSMIFSLRRSCGVEDKLGFATPAWISREDVWKIWFKNTFHLPAGEPVHPTTTAAAVFS